MSRLAAHGLAKRLQYGPALRESEAGMTQTGGDRPGYGTAASGRRTGPVSKETQGQQIQRLKEMVDHLPQPIPEE